MGCQRAALAGFGLFLAVVGAGVGVGGSAAVFFLLGISLLTAAFLVNKDRSAPKATLKASLMVVGLMAALGSLSWLGSNLVGSLAFLAGAGMWFAGLRVFSNRTRARHLRTQAASPEDHRFDS